MSWLNLLTNIDKQIGNLILIYGTQVYLIIFAAIFLETALVILPFLPGDTLLFVLGAFCAGTSLNIFLLFFILSIAAILGDNINYTLGKYLGTFLAGRFIDKEDIEKTNAFYHKHGGKTILFARFIPIIRSLSPFVAGVSKMQYAKFLSFDLIGAMLWVGSFLAAGYFLGTIPFVSNNLTVIIIIIFILSLFVPITFKYVKRWTKKAEKVVVKEIKEDVNPNHITI